MWGGLLAVKPSAPFIEVKVHTIQCIHRVVRLSPLSASRTPRTPEGNPVPTQQSAPFMYFTRPLEGHLESFLRGGSEREWQVKGAQRTGQRRARPLPLPWSGEGRPYSALPGATDRGQEAADVQAAEGREDPPPGPPSTLCRTVSP